MKFEGQNEYLSNAFECTINYNDLIFKNAESAYQSNKFTSIEDKKKLTEMDATQARIFGRMAHINKDTWDKDRCNIMYKVVKAKFDQHPELKIKLLSIENDMIEFDSHDDKFWGMDGVENHRKLGQNKLGKILTQIRDEYKREAKRK